MKKILILLSLLVSISASAEQSQLELAVSNTVSKVKAVVSAEAEVEIQQKSTLGLSIEIGKQLAIAGANCSLGILNILAENATAAYIAIESIDGESDSKIDDAQAKFNDVMEHNNSRDYSLVGETTACVKSATLLNMASSEATTRVLNRDTTKKK